MKIRALIVDDEPLARERVAGFLRKEEDVEIVGECGDGQSAILAITEREPNLVFLDVQMPEMDGFDVIRALPKENRPIFVFVTAHDQHAVEAFTTSAIDYLLKPFKQTRFRQTMDRVRANLISQDTLPSQDRLEKIIDSFAPKNSYLTRFVIKVSGKVLFLRTGDVQWIEAAGNYVELHVGSQTHLIRETMTSLESRLDPKQFLRISRSMFVNVDQILELRPLFKGDYSVVLRGGQELPMTRGLREVQEILKFS